jgi:hypothetical protein
VFSRKFKNTFLLRHQESDLLDSSKILFVGNFKLMYLQLRFQTELHLAYLQNQSEFVARFVSGYVICGAIPLAQEPKVFNQFFYFFRIDISYNN